MAVAILLALPAQIIPPLAHGTAQANVQAIVRIIDYAFLPKHINVTTGTVVIWSYASNWSSLHTVTSVGNTTSNGSPLLNSGTLHPGQNYTFTFYNPGLYTYQCAYHPTTPAMTNAWVNVTGSPVAPPASQSPPDYTLIAIAGGVVGVAVVATVALFLRRKRGPPATPTVN